MASNYYYLVATLPYLMFDTKPPLSREDFISECGKWFSGGDLKVVQDIDINSIKIEDGDLSLIKVWKGFNKELKEDIASIRVAKKNLYQEKKDAVYKDVFSEETPLLMEKKVERIRWDFVDQHELWYDFDVNKLVLYFLKLQILERLAEFDKKEGKRVFEELCEVNTDQRPKTANADQRPDG